jgi:hypothetical protein
MVFSRVEATNSAAFRGLDRLTVDDAGGGAGLAPFAFARCHDQFIVDRAQQAIVAPAVEIFLHR